MYRYKLGFSPLHFSTFFIVTSKTIFLIVYPEYFLIIGNIPIFE